MKGERRKTCQGKRYGRRYFLWKVSKEAWRLSKESSLAIDWGGLCTKVRVKIRIYRMWNREGRFEWLSAVALVMRSCQVDPELCKSRSPFLSGLGRFFQMVTDEWNELYRRTLSSRGPDRRDTQRGEQNMNSGRYHRLKMPSEEFNCWRWTWLAVASRPLEKSGRS